MRTAPNARTTQATALKPWLSRRRPLDAACAHATFTGVETTLRTVVEPLLTIPFACASELTSGVVATDVWIQGVLVPLDTSLVALSSQLSHPDRFLHICLRRRRTRAEASLNVN